MKRILSAILALVLCLSLCACGGKRSIKQNSGLRVGFKQAKRS